jgi:phospholipase/carboxylesterase
MPTHWRDTLSAYRCRLETIHNLDVYTVASESTPADSIAVLMHGYGAPRDDLLGLAEPLLIQCLQTGKSPALVFPGAPIELDFGGAAWWPLNMAKLMQAAATNSFDRIRDEVPSGIDAASRSVAEVINHSLQTFGLTESKLMVGGFSQGSMLAMNVAIVGLANPPAALCLWSGASVCESIYRERAADRLKATRVFQSHGKFDSVLPLQTGRFLNELLNELCGEVDYVEFDGAHQIPQAAIDGFAKLL